MGILDFRHVLSLRRWRWIIISTIIVGSAIIFIEQAELLGVESNRLTQWRQSAHSALPLLPHPEARPSYSFIGEAVQAHASGRILVTGGGGNVGKHLIRRLLSSSIPTTVMDLIFHNDELEEIYHEYSHARSLLSVVLGDIRDKDALRRAMTSDVVGVINLAAVSRVLWCLENEPDCEDVNVGGTSAILEAMEQAERNPWFIQSSSREVYGIADVFPVTEDTPHHPANVYGASKAKAEDEIERHIFQRKDRGDGSGIAPLHAIALRISNVYGGRSDHRERLIPAIMTNALAHRTIQIVGGAQDLDMIHVDDVIDAFTLAINRLEGKGTQSWFGHLWTPSRRQESSDLEIFNIAAGSSAPAMSLIKKILKITDSASPLQTIDGDDRFPDNYVGSTVKAAEVLGFEARVGIDEGIQRLAMAYLGETIDYLDHKLQAECSAKPSYSIKDLLNLEGCIGTLAVEGLGQVGYLFTNNEETDPLERWGWRDDVEPQSWKFHVESVQGGQEAFIQLSQQGSDGQDQFFEGRADGQILGAVESKFRVSVDPTTGYVSFTLAFSGRPLGIASIVMRPLIPRQLGINHRFRLTPFCCPGKRSPWPFFKEDPLGSAINDLRFETTRDFAASPRKTLCRRIKMALDVAQAKFDRLAKMSLSIELEEAPLPSGSPSEWRHRNLPTCINLCDHPTVCLDTGECACSQSSCVPRLRFPFASFANLPGVSYPSPTLDWAALSVHDPDILVNQVTSSSWRNVLRPYASRYLSRNPNFPSIHLTRLPDDVQRDRDENAEDYDRLRSTGHGCFSADSVLERGVKLISSEYASNSLVFLPYYSGTKNFPPFDQWANNALQHHLPADFDSTRLISPFTFDWGVCNTVLRTLFMVREYSSPQQEMLKGTSWAPMGDVNSPCYRIDQDIVVPARTCLQEELREIFREIASVRPVRQRSILVAFKGSLNGAGVSIREKVMCDRPYRDLPPPRLEGGTLLARHWNEYKEEADYLETMNDTIFCPLPRGTTGWATRTIDAIYAGCIPVRIGDQTHFPYWDTLDWAKFSLQIMDTDLDHMEEILLDRSWAEVQRLQTNLMLIREAFLYPAEGNMEENLSKRGPFFFALHGTAMLRKTLFPT